MLACFVTTCSAKADIAMIETNPVHAQIADLQSRIDSLRGYL